MFPYASAAATVSLRTEGRFTEAPALQLANPDRIGRLEIGPLSLAALHYLLKERTGRAYPRPELVRILSPSGGNPFFGLALARVLGQGPPPMQGAASAIRVLLGHEVPEACGERMGSWLSGQVSPGLNEGALRGAAHRSCSATKSAAEGGATG